MLAIPLKMPTKKMDKNKSNELHESWYRVWALKIQPERQLAAAFPKFAHPAARLSKAPANPLRGNGGGKPRLYGYGRFGNCPCPGVFEFCPACEAAESAYGFGGMNAPVGGGIIGGAGCPNNPFNNPKIGAGVVCWKYRQKAKLNCNHISTSFLCSTNSS